MPEQPAALSFPVDFSPSDRLMWKIERDPVLRSPVLAIGLLDREPDWSAVRRTFARAVERVPRLRQKVEVSGPAGRRIRWVDDPAFSLDYHLRRVRAPHPGDMDAVLALTAPFAISSLDAARPQWELTLVEGLEGGRAAFVMKFHHTITDGVGGVDLAGTVFDTSRRGSARSAKAAPPPEPETEPEDDALWRQVAGAMRVGLRAATQPTATAKGAVRFAKSLARMLEPVPEPMSPVLRGRSLDRQLHALEFPMAEFRAAAQAAGGTINDVFLAGVAGGLHDFHERLGHEVPALRVTMPINLRSENDPPGGNRFTPARFVLPIDDPDPVVRAHIAGNIARRWRREPAVGLTDVLAMLLDQLPPSVVTPLFGSMLKNVDIDATDIPGLAEPAFLGGARIDRMWAFAPPTGAALSVTLLSHIDTACIGLVSDLAAVSDAELLATCLQSAFEDVIALGHAVTTMPAAS